MPLEDDRLRPHLTRLVRSARVRLQELVREHLEPRHLSFGSGVQRRIEHRSPQLALVLLSARASLHRRALPHPLGPAIRMVEPEVHEPLSIDPAYRHRSSGYGTRPCCDSEASKTSARKYRRRPTRTTALRN